MHTPGPWNITNNCRKHSLQVELLDELRLVAEGLTHIDTPWARERLGFIELLIAKATYEEERR